ncbi:hypothetical protein [Planctomycetes bacterium K23_9]|uniref:3-keto-disaccharide hydrolase domain-containing protein n=1 Tax=Stieleria marina TaxID=1930275 RepID=A0A517NMT4_9BACT|nr:hypothetical protein K239x_03760 [Planctomycetes bacterium K23_9]
MKYLSPLFAFALLSCSISMAADTPPANSELVVDQSFDEAELGKGWHINTGSWKVINGVFQAKEIKADKHSAAARHVIETQNAVYQVRFRLVGESPTFHFGFDPKRGELDKKGHLFSVIINAQKWQIMKHVDKAKPKVDPNEILASEKVAFEKDKWYTLRVTTWGPYVTAKIDDSQELKASHPTFSVKKPTLVFRCIGESVELDDLRVWRQKS